MKLINIGFGNLVSAGRVVAVVSPDSAPVKRLVKEARERGMLIDASYGRSTRAVLIMDSDHVVLSALSPRRWQAALRASRKENDRGAVKNGKRKVSVCRLRCRRHGQGQCGQALRTAHPEIEKTVSATTRLHPAPGSRKV